MGRIPQSFINDLLTRVDIVEIVDSRLTLRKAGKDYQALCPFHNEKTPSFSVVPDKQFYHCFGCGASGTALTFLMEFDRLEFVEAVEELARTAGVEVPREHGDKPQKDHSDLYAVLGEAQVFYRRSLKAHADAVDYLRKRGLSGEVARDFGIGFAPEAWDALRQALAAVPEQRLLEAGLVTKNDAGRVYDRFRGRVMFPIRDTRGRIIGFGGRIIAADDKGPKYLNSPETEIFHKGRELYGLYEARRALKRLDRLIVVEGYMDVVALAQAGIANAVATLGTSATAEHFQKLYRYTEEVVCCFDGDNAGRRAAWRALESALPVLKEGRQLRFMFLPEGEDPDSLVRARGQADFLERAAGAEPAIEYLFNRLQEGLDLRNVDHKARLAGLAVPFIEKVPEGILRELMSRRLAELTGVAPGRAAAARRPGPVASRTAAGGQRPIDNLSRRLLARLLRKPALLLCLPPEHRRRLSEQPEPDLFVEVVRYLDQNPGADTAEILGRWSGTPEHDVLLGLAAERLALPEPALQAELAEGVARYLASKEKAARLGKAAQLRHDPSTKAFQELVGRRQRQPASDGG